MPSERILEQKRKAVQEVSEKLKNAKSFILADYRGLTVDQDTELRSEMRNAGVEYKVIKNTITLRAAKDNGYGDLEKFIEGPTAIAISNSDSVAPAKILAKFEKKFEKLELKAGIVEGKLVDIAQIKAIADLPSREELIAKVLGGLNSPIAGLVNVLNANIKGLLVALNGIAEQKQNA